MGPHIIIKNSKTIVGRFASAAEARQEAQKLLMKNTTATYEYAKVLKKSYTAYTPPVYTPIEEDV
jgi:hypothetical protein